MIDIHSHILPGLDDGAETLEESMAMLRVAAGSGTTDIVATPHANAEFRYDPQRIQQIFSQVRTAANGLIRVHLGCDFHISYENVQDALAHPDRYTINNFCYLMVELPDLVMPDAARNVMSQLRSVGMIPVVTHPERNVAVQSRIDVLRQWVKDGCLLQITAQSLLGRFGAEAERSAEALLKEQLVHFIASDAHDCEDRPPRLDEAHQCVTRMYGAERAELLCRTNPGKVLTGEPLDAAPDKKWYRFWK